MHLGVKMCLFQCTLMFFFARHNLRVILTFNDAVLGGSNQDLSSVRDVSHPVEFHVEATGVAHWFSLCVSSP